MRVLVLGSQGQLGQELTALCRARNVAFSFAARSECDIANEAHVRATLKSSQPSVVINTAAYTKVDKAEVEPRLAYLTNCDGAGVVAHLCAEFEVPLIHVSTDYVFDGTKALPYTEDDEVAPLGVYGSSKEAGERAIRNALANHIIIRTAWVFGPYGHNFLKTMLNLAATRETWGVVADQIGTPTATIDLATALLAAAQQATHKSACWGTYHFSGQGDGSWFDFAQEIVSAQVHITGRTPVIRPISTEEYPTPARRPRNSRLNSDRFDAVFGVRALPWRERTRSVVEAVLTKFQERGQ